MKKNKRMHGKKDEFLEYQKQWNEENVEDERFYWQTRNRIIVEKEHRLLEHIKDATGTKVLEVGCGEGANIKNLEGIRGIHKSYTGIDFSSTRIKFANKKAKGHSSTFKVGDGTKIDFKDNSFDVVFCRDVIHHVWEHDKLLSEMYRVCRPGGKVLLIESNAWNPVNMAFGLLFKKESGMKKIHPRYIRRLFSKLKIHKGLTIGKKMSIGYSEAYNLDRLIFHYRMGLPKLSNYRFVRCMNNIVNRIFEMLTPKIFRGYMIVELKK